MSEKSKKSGFFDETEDENAPVTEEKAVTPTPEKAGKKKTAKKVPSSVKAVGLCFLVLLCVWGGVKYLSKRDDIKESAYYPDAWTQTEQRKPVLKFYEPDYETDITEIPEYMSLNRMITYSPDGMQRIGLLPEDYYTIGGNGLVFMADYINALIAGDYEKVNSMFADEYFGENEPYGQFTQQKLFNINVTKYAYHDEKYEDTHYDDLYYIVSYSIYHNDATFRADIDEECILPQLFELLVYPDKTIKIQRIIDIPGFIY